MSKNYKFISQSAFHEFSQDEHGNQKKYGYNIRIDDNDGKRKISGQYN